MTTTGKPTESIAEQAKAIYEANIRAQVEAEHFGEFLALDVDSGDWEVDKNLLDASNRLRAPSANAHVFPAGRTRGGCRYEWRPNMIGFVSPQLWALVQVRV
jgi:hypothetical protein